jgi:hypothetical protein
VSRIKLIWAVRMDAQNIFLSENQKLCIVRTVPPPQEGRFAVVTDVGGGMRWTLRLCVDARSLKRTAKSCGSGAPKQALSSRRCSRVLRVTVATKRWSPRRARISRKTIAQGMPDDPALPVVTAACFFCCRRAMGEVVTRHSLRPLFSEGDQSSDSSGATRREIVASFLGCLEIQSCNSTTMT